KAIHGDVDTHATLGRLDHHFLQLPSDLVFENDEGFQHDAALGIPYRVEHRGKETFAVFKQSEPVTDGPFGRHSESSTAKGAWSDKCVHGLEDSFTGSK